MDRVSWYYSLNPPSSWMNQYERDVRLGNGQFWWNALGGNSYFSNLCVVPNSGLNINVGPCGVNSLASLYQYLPEETTTFGGPTGALPTDNTQVDLEGLMASAQSIGPLNGPGTAGWSIIYTVECKVSTVDTNSMSENFVSVLGAVTSSNVNRDRADQISCQSKAGVAAASPSPPVVDAGYLGVANVQVPQGTSTITSGMITALTANGFYGFPLLDSAGNLPVNGNITSTGTVTGAVVQSKANASVAGPAGPCYTNGGVGCPSTWHTNSFTVATSSTTCTSIAAGASCAITGSPISLPVGYLNATTYLCIVGYSAGQTPTVAAAGFLFTTSPVNGSTFTLNATNITTSTQSATIGAITNLGFNCWGT